MQCRSIGLREPLFIADRIQFVGGQVASEVDMFHNINVMCIESKM